MKNTSNIGSFQADKGEGRAPMQAHMALQTGSLDGDPDSLLAIPKGATLFFIEDPKIPHTIIQCVLHKVVYENHQFKGLELYAVTSSDKSTRKLYLTAAWVGEFRSSTEAAHKAADAEIAKGLKR